MHTVLNMWSDFTVVKNGTIEHNKAHLISWNISALTLDIVKGSSLGTDPGFFGSVGITDRRVFPSNSQQCVDNSVKYLLLYNTHYLFYLSYMRYDIAKCPSMVYGRG